MVDVVFGLVFAQGLLLFRVVLIDPLHAKYAVIVTGLLAIYYTTIRSWIDWHITMERNPYSIFRTDDTTSSPETARIYFDFAIVSVYAYLLFQLHTLVPDQTNSLRGYLIGFVMVFALYLASGVIRQWTHGQRASNRESITIFLLVFVTITAAYEAAYYHWRWAGEHQALVNELFALLSLVGMLSYRRFRSWMRRRSL